jgi:GTP 3',8-cyclase
MSAPVVLGRRHQPAGPAPAARPLLDVWGRVHTDLRVSVTDRCNLRCAYCMPEEGVEWLPREDLLNVEEIERVARVARQLGVRSLRLTGGEPLLRPRLVDIVVNDPSFIQPARPMSRIGG